MRLSPRSPHLIFSGDRAAQAQQASRLLNGPHERLTQLLGNLRITEALGLIHSVFPHYWGCRTISSQGCYLVPRVSGDYGISPQALRLSPSLYTFHPLTHLQAWLMLTPKIEASSVPV